MNTDFLIIGQGLAGTMLAYELHKKGLNYKIVSSKDISSASMVAAGMYNPLVFKRVTKSWQIDELMPVMNSTYKEISELLDTEIYYKTDIMKPINKEDISLWEKKNNEEKFSSYIKEIGISESPEGCKDQFSWVKISQSGYLDLSKMLNGLRQLFIRQGNYIESTFEHKDLEVEGLYVKWKDIKSKNIIFCEGSHAVNNPYFKDLGFNPTKGEVIEIESENLSQEFILNKNGFILPLGNNKFKVGATYDWKFTDEKTSEEGKKILIEKLDKLINTEYTIIKHLAGIRPTIIDRRPMLGASDIDSKIKIFNGLGTKGVMLAPFYAKEMMNFLSTDNFELNKEVDIKRFYKNKQK